MPTFPGFEHIYFLTDPLSKRPLRGETKGDCLALTRGDSVARDIVRVSWYMGGPTPSDFVWTGNVGAVIVHRRVISLMRDHGFSGWQSYSVNVLDREGKSHPEYEGLVILGRCDRVDLSRSTIVLSKYPAGWFPHFLGHYFNEHSWDGSDIFMERADSRGHVTAHVFITEQVQRAFARAKIKNVRFKRLSDSSVNTSNFEIGAEYLLPRDFSQTVDDAYRLSGIPRPNDD